MKVRVFFVLVAAILLSASSVNSEITGLIKTVISNILKTIPELKADINRSMSSQTTSVSYIVQNGFTYFKQQADIEQYNGVQDDNLSPFLNYLKEMVQLPEAYAKFFVENLSMIEFSDFNEIVVFRILFSKDMGGDCKYICVMGQRNENTGSTDWLVADVRTQFKLAPDVMIIEKSKSSLWGIIKSTERKYIQVPKNLEKSQLDILVKFFEVIVFERFGELLKINPQQVFLGVDDTMAIDN